MSGLDPDDNRPPYQQVATAVRDLIGAGEFGPGAKLPKHEELIETYGVSLGTVKRALGLLQDEGLIVSRRGEGAFVRSRPSPQQPTADRPAGADDSGLREEVADLRRRLEAVERKLDQRP